MDQVLIIMLQKELLLLEHQRNQNLVLTLTQEIRKSVDDSMEGIISSLCNEVIELQSIKENQPQNQKTYGPKQGRLDKTFLVSFDARCS